jgi:hypothetical protein
MGVMDFLAYERPGCVNFRSDKQNKTAPGGIPAEREKMKRKYDSEPVSAIITGRPVASKTRWSAVADAMMPEQCYLVKNYNEAIGLRGALLKRGKKCRFEQTEKNRRAPVYVHCIALKRKAGENDKGH